MDCWADGHPELPRLSQRNNAWSYAICPRADYGALASAMLPTARLTSAVSPGTGGLGRFRDAILPQKAVKFAVAITSMVIKGFDNGNRFRVS